MAALILLAAAGAMADPIPKGGALDFDIYREGSKIGRHTVTFAGDAKALNVSIAIDIKVELGFITLFRYTHRSIERWADGKLISIATTTDDDGDKTDVKAQAEGEKLRVTGSGGSFLAAADTMPTSYWDEAMLKHARLLDTQEGKLVDLKVKGPMEETIKIGGRDIRARHYTVSGDLKLDLWYLPNGEWAKLVFKAENDGSTITYERRTPIDLAAIPGTTPQFAAR